MSITASLLFNETVRNVEVYDRQGSDRPLIHGGAYADGDVAEIGPIFSTLCCHHPAEGVVQIRGEVLVNGEWQLRPEGTSDPFDFIVVYDGETHGWPS